MYYRVSGFCGDEVIFTNQIQIFILFTLFFLFNRPTIITIRIFNYSTQYQERNGTVHWIIFIDVFVVVISCS